MLHHKLKRFIEKKDGTFLVVGAPGTGKTHVLLELISYLLVNKNISPKRILVFSFNRRWAKILRENTSENAEKSLVEIPVTSFFAYSAEIIEKNLFSQYFGNHTLPAGTGSHFQYSGPKILTAPDQWKLLKEVISENLDKKNYPVTFRFLEGNKHIYRSYIQEVFDFILRAQENLLTPQVLSNKFTPYYNQVLSEIVGIYSNYLECLKSRGLYNYGRLLFDAQSILQNNKRDVEFYRKSYDFVIVDEFQEINRAQFKIVQSISDNNAIFFGNDDECTYAFRGSMINNFNSVFDALISGKSTANRGPGLGECQKLSSCPPKEFPVTGGLQNILLLEQNFRSSYLINEACQQFIKANEDRISKKSRYSTSPSGNGGTLEIKEFKTAMDEIIFICSRIKNLILLKNIKAEEICIIVKGMSYKTSLLANMLDGNSIPFVHRSSRTILKNPFIKYILNFLKFIVLQDSNQNIPVQDEMQLFWSLLCSEPVGLSPVFVKTIFDVLAPYLQPGFNPRVNSTCRKTAGFKLVDNIKQFLKENAGLLASLDQKKSKKSKSALEKESIYLKDLQRLSDFISALDKYIKLNADGATAGKIIDGLVNDASIGVLKYLLSGKKNAGYVAINAVSLLGDYLNTVNDFAESNPDSNTAEKYLIFLEDIISNNFLEEIEESTKEFLKPGFVNILSYHQCKGLEFDAVFMPFINENYLPSAFGKSQLYDMQIFNYFTDGKSYSEAILKRKHLADERKLFYTGMSRAKNHLFVTSNNSESRSMFFEEIDDIAGNIKKNVLFRNKKNIKKENKKKTDGNKQEGLSGKLSANYRDFRLASAEKWLIRKRAVSKIFKKINNMKTGSDTLIEDLVYLKEMYPPAFWWRIKKTSLNNNFPFRIAEPVFSYSALSSYLECPVKYKINYFYKLKQEKTLGLLIGNIYHDILKMYFEHNKKDFSWANLEKEIKIVFGLEKYRTFEFSYLKKEIFEKALEDFKNYYEGFISGRILEVVGERAFNFDIEGSRIKGRIDQINFIDEASVELIDFKSGRKNPSIINAESEIQLRLYRMAVDLSPELADLRGKEYGMKYIFLGEKKNQQICLDKNFYDFGQFYNFIKKIIAEIKKERFSSGPKSTFTCKSCEYRVICNARK